MTSLTDTLLEALRPFAEWNVEAISLDRHGDYEIHVSSTQPTLGAFANARAAVALAEREVVKESLTTEGPVSFLREAATYFRNRPTNGEDSAHWANVYNAENCEKAADRIEALERELAEAKAALNTSRVNLQKMEDFTVGCDAAIVEAVEAEREAAAQIADDLDRAYGDRMLGRWHSHEYQAACGEIARTIRARGQP